MGRKKQRLLVVNVLVGIVLAIIIIGCVAGILLMEANEIPSVVSCGAAVTCCCLSVFRIEYLKVSQIQKYATKKPIFARIQCVLVVAMLFYAYQNERAGELSVGYAVLLALICNSLCMLLEIFYIIYKIYRE